MRGRWRWLLPLALLVAGWATAAPASALPANPWTGRWLVPKATIPCNDRPELGVTGDQVFSATQTGSRVTFTYTLPGGQRGTIAGSVSPDGATLTAGNAPDGWTEGPPAYCFGTGHGSVTLQMAPDAGSFTTVSGSTDFGNPINITGTYQGGGTKPPSRPGRHPGAADMPRRPVVRRMAGSHPRLHDRPERLGLHGIHA